MAGPHIGAELGAQQIVAFGAVILDLGNPPAVGSGRLLGKAGRGRKRERSKRCAAQACSLRPHLELPRRYNPFGLAMNSSMISGGGLMKSETRLTASPFSRFSFTASSAIFTSIGMPLITGAPSTACPLSD